MVDNPIMVPVHTHKYISLETNAGRKFFCFFFVEKSLKNLITSNKVCSY